MKVLLDENLSLDIIKTALRDQGHEVVTVRDTGLMGTTDEVLWEFAKNNDLVFMVLRFHGQKSEIPLPPWVYEISVTPDQTLNNICARLKERFRPYPFLR